MSLRDHPVVVIGSGFAGLCMAIRLKEAGIDDFIVLEKAGDKERPAPLRGQVALFIVGEETLHAPA